MHADAWRAVRLLKRREELFVAPQNIVEMWVVATRPLAQNGLGISPPEASAYLNRFKRFLPLLPDTPEIHAQWEQLVDGLDTVLTFNVDDFKRYAGVVALHPASVR